MANLKEVRTRISSVNSTRQITSAMKMVSAAKLKRAQDAITQMRPYSVKMSGILANLSDDLAALENPYTTNREENNVLFVVITSNRGLCGAFNANVIKKTQQLILNEYSNSNCFVTTIGKKAHDVFKKTDWLVSESQLSEEHNEFWSEVTFENASEIAEELMGVFAEEKFDKVVLVYNQFKNAASQILTAEQMLPIQPVNNDDTKSNGEYIFQPSKSDILAGLVPTALKTQLYKALLDSQASEHGARMTAMHKATDNASELLHDLKLTYNKARQAAITTEILEIVAGAEALDG